MTSLGIVLRAGPYQTQRWETAYRLARAARDRSDPVTIFLYMDGVYNALSTQTFAGMDHLPSEHLESLLDSGVGIYACKTCTDNRGLEDGREYLKRVKISGATRAAEMASSCDRVITL